MDQEINLESTTITYSVPMGTIVAFALSKDSIPNGWLLCDGSTIPSQYQVLIEALGSNTTPNLAGRTIIGTGSPTNAPQSDTTTPNFPDGITFTDSLTGGEYVHKLTPAELAVHSHTVNGGNFGYHSRSFDGEDDGDLPYETNPSHGLGGTDNSGGDQAHNTMQPYLTMNYIIFAGQ